MRREKVTRYEISQDKSRCAISSARGGVVL